MLLPLWAKDGNRAPFRDKLAGAKNADALAVAVSDVGRTSCAKSGQHTHINADQFDWRETQGERWAKRPARSSRGVARGMFAMQSAPRARGGCAVKRFRVRLVYLPPIYYAGEASSAHPKLLRGNSSSATQLSQHNPARSGQCGSLLPRRRSPGRPAAQRHNTARPEGGGLRPRARAFDNVHEYLAHYVVGRRCARAGCLPWWGVGRSEMDSSSVAWLFAFLGTCRNTDSEGESESERTEREPPA